MCVEERDRVRERGGREEGREQGKVSFFLIECQYQCLWKREQQYLPLSLFIGYAKKQSQIINYFFKYIFDVFGTF